MENLPESLYVDPSSSTSSHITPRNTTRSFSATDRHEIEQLIKLINRPQTRAEAINQLNRVYKINKEREIRVELGLLLWNSKGTAFALLQEFTSVYRFLSPPRRLDMVETNRVCNALALLQCIASHPEARMGLIKAQMPVYIYPFLNTTEQQLVQFDHLRFHSLNVIATLVKEECSYTSEIVHFLLESEMVPLCLRCMDVGDQTTKTVATFVLVKILEQQEGKIYCGSFVERFFAVSKALSKLVDGFSGKPPAQLLKNILFCYLYLSNISSLVERRDALEKCYPQRLRNPAYLNFVCDASNRCIADKVVHNITVARQVQPAPPLENQFSVLRL